MSERPRDEKMEKEEEKQEKEREKEEKSWDEKWRQDPLGAVVWALILIWAGVVFLAETMGLLASLRTRGVQWESSVFARLEPWWLVLVGAGLILLLEVAVRLLVPAYRRPVGGTLILAAVLLGIGFGNLFSWSLVLPLVLIAAGVGILLRGLAGRG
ncbi:MAG: hypothetical protein GX605_02760 [Chloroflexi bacterium]|nr:hypothetical protein [Chloroflexota bacterium]